MVAAMRTRRSSALNLALACASAAPTTRLMGAWYLRARAHMHVRVHACVCACVCACVGSRERARACSHVRACILVRAHCMRGH